MEVPIAENTMYMIDSAHRVFKEVIDIEDVEGR